MSSGLLELLRWPFFRSLLRGATLASTLGIAAAANAQLSASVEAFAGYYRPFGRFESPSNYSTGLPSQPSELRGAAWGAAAHLRLARRFGVAGEIGGGALGMTLVVPLRRQLDLSADATGLFYGLEVPPSLEHRGA